MKSAFHRLARLRIVENFDSGTVLVEPLDFVTATVTFDLKDGITELRRMRGNFMNRLPVRARSVGAMIARSGGNCGCESQTCDQ